MDALSLIVLCATLVVAFVFKINSGLVAIAVSLILSWIAGVPGKFLISSFNSSLFLMLLGVMYLFCLAQENRTLELLARKAVVLCRGQIKLIPVVLFVFSAVISAIGPGLIWVNLRHVSLNGNDLFGTHAMTYIVIIFCVLAIFACNLLPKEYDTWGRKVTK